MIEQLIGSGILVAVGGMLGFWLGLLLLRRHLSLALELLNERDDEIEAQRAIARLNGEAVQHWQAVVGNALEYCKQFRVRGAVVAGILSGEQDQ